MSSQRARRKRDAQSKVRIGRLTSEIQQIRDGAYPSGSSEVSRRKLLPIDYRALIESLALNEDLAGYFYDKIRVEGVPTGRDGKRIVEIARKINSLGTTPIKFDGSQLHPDCSYRYGSAADTQHPNMVVEVAWSRQPCKLRIRARELIHKSGGEIRTVVGLNFHGTWKIWETLKNQLDHPNRPHRGPVDAIVFRAVFDHETSQALFDSEGQPMITETPYVFCNEYGKIDLSQQLRLELEDFVPEGVLRTNIKGKSLRSVELVIDTLTLMRYYDELLADQKVFDENDKSEKGNKKRKRGKQD
ncbi:hypothetical protein E0Z10_g9774 [Xylaria hypoxylon]|uniref:Restriction endonuclease domain-containing protein n=1 Tax=Xylaria hypoxylon TaxID=37992 RepID=A0A4Z0YJD9_9PEZI|nr:hypothetical protein E0Z10_g9774 [Xylaria hypoxylon]